MDILEVSKELKARLQPIFGSRFGRLILFGSYARRDFSSESDLDFLLTLTEPTLNPFRELALATPVLQEFILRYGKVFSLIATSEDKFHQFDSSFFTAVRQDGIEIP